MNSRTAKLLKKFARVSSKEEKQVKQWWNRLTSKERADERKRIAEIVEEAE